MVAPGTPAPRGHRQHHPRPFRRAARDRRDRRDLVPVLGRHPPRRRLHARRCSTRWRRWTGRSSSTRPRTKIAWANVQLMPDPTILSMETGTRHRTAERVSKQTEALVIAISARRDVVSLYVEGIKYILQDIPTVLSQGEPGPGDAGEVPHPARPDVSARLTAAEFAGEARPLRRARRAPARRDGHAHGRRGRALHHRARHRGPADRDAARGDRRRRDGRPRRARARLRGRGHRAARGGDPPGAGGPAARGGPRLRPPRRAARLRPQDVHRRVHRRPPRLPGARRGSRGCRAWSPSGWSSASATSTRSSPRATRELASVDGVGETRARDIREGLRRLQEVDLVDRYP